MAEEWTELVWVTISVIAFSVVLTIAFNFVQIGKGVTNTLYQEQADNERIKDIQMFLPYDNVELSGSEAFSAAVKMSNNGYLTMIVCDNATGSSSKKAIFMHSSQITKTQAATNLNNVGDPATLLNYDTWRNYVQSDSSYVFSTTNTTYTTPALLTEFDNIAKLVTGDNTKTFSELSFRSKLMTDTMDKPFGVVLYRVNSGMVVS